MTDNLEQRIRQVLALEAADEKHQDDWSAFDLFFAAPEMAAIIRELLGVIDSQRMVLNCVWDEMHDDVPLSTKACEKVVQARHISAPLQGWKEWGV